MSTAAQAAALSGAERAVKKAGRRRDAAAAKLQLVSAQEQLLQRRRRTRLTFMLGEALLIIGKTDRELLARVLAQAQRTATREPDRRLLSATIAADDAMPRP